MKTMFWSAFCLFVVALCSIPQTEGLTCYNITRIESMGRLSTNIRGQLPCPAGQSCLSMTADLKMRFSLMTVSSSMVMGVCIPTVACNYLNCNTFTSSLIGSVGRDTTIESCRISCCDTDLCNDRPEVIASTQQAPVVVGSRFIPVTQIMTTTIETITSALGSAVASVSQRGPTCGQTELITNVGTPKKLESPGWPQNYPTSFSCDWTIRAPSDHVIRFTVNSFNTERYSDRLKLFEVGINETLRKLSGSVNKGVTFFSRSNHVTARFRSDSTVADHGFSIELVAFGIGRGIAKKLVECGAEVCALSRTQSDLDSLKQECPSIKVVQCDLSDREATSTAIRLCGPIDLLVNNAGILIPAPFMENTLDIHDKIMETNLRAPLQISQIVAKGMVERKSGGSIVNISSIFSIRGKSDFTSYGASKAALEQMTRTMCLELGKHNIRVNAVNPTFVYTAMSKIFETKFPEQAAALKATIPLGRFCNIDDVVPVVLFLLSDAASMVSGSCLPVDGGGMASLVT